jgi:hypothetical protein
VVPDGDDPYGSAAALMDAVPPESHLVLSHMASDVQPEDMAQVQARLAERMRTTNPPALRSHDEVSRFFDGLDLVPPGVVRIDQWHPETPPTPGARPTPIYGGVARKA